jgi:nitroimidazol reductase NimA-like FMN-containing flavoprotein (pyridoxamine 5'-phosphate oxidase superfamily)
MLRNPAELKRLVLRIMDDNRTMAVATVRADGWPQATTVGFVHDDLAIYFAVARTSQKLANIQRDPRTSIAIGHATGGDRAVRGFSLAAQTTEVSDWHEVARLNDLIRDRYPEVQIFAPRDSNAAVLKAEPTLISLVDDAEGLRQPLLLQVSGQTELAPAP